MHQHGKTTNILLVEDDVALVEALTQKFSSHKTMQVSKALNGEAGLKTALKTKPDIIILDIIMPKMDGIEMLQKLRENEWGRSVPVILLTNIDPDDDLLEKVMRCTPCYYLVKTNTSLDEIVGKVKSVLRI